MEVFYSRQRRHSTINYEASLVFEAAQAASSPSRSFVGKIVEAAGGSIS